MAIRPPEDGDLRTVADHYRLGLSEADLASFKPFATGLLGCWDAVEELYARTAPAAPDRPGSGPDDADNPLRRVVRDREIGEARRRPARRAHGGDQGQHHGRRRADDERLGDARGLRARPRRHGGHPPAGRRRHDHRQGGRARTCASRAAATRRGPGPVRNPWDPTRSAGGSSSGSAALVAGGEVDIAMGGDQGGSVRIPSAYSGIVGHKPTLRPRPVHRRVPDRADDRPPRPDDPHRRRRRARARRDRRARRPRSPPAARRRRRRLHRRAGRRLRRAADRRRHRGLRHPELRARASTTPCARPSDVLARRRGHRRRRLGALAPRTRCDVWNVIATEGATAQMVDGNAYGMN